MHEISIMAGVFEAMDNVLSGCRCSKVTQVKLKVGKLTDAEPAALEFAFEAFARGHKSEGAALIIEEMPITGFCRECQREFEIEQLFFYCPNCKNFPLEVLSGTELYLESLEVES